MIRSPAYRIAIAMRDSHIFDSRGIWEDCDYIVIPVPWDATASYRLGTAFAPEAIIEATHQVDTYDLEFDDNIRGNVYVDSPIREASEANEICRHLHERVLNGDQGSLLPLNQISHSVHEAIKERVSSWLSLGKHPIVLGGDNSVSLGSILAHNAHYEDLSVLHFDAHADLREAYQGIRYSHASIMFNVMQMSDLHITQVGVRDLSQPEYDRIMSSNGRIIPYFAKDILKNATDNTFEDTAARIVSTLSQNVYICLDVDVLDIGVVPNTGTPVPGGLNWWQLNSIFKACAKSGRRIVGFDINESAADGNDPIIAARLLHKLIGWSASNA